MKKWIHSRTQTDKLIIEKIAAIIVVGDAREQEIKGLPIVAVTGSDPFDYDQYSIEELMNELTTKELRKIDTFYALDNLMTAVRDYGFDYTFTQRQKDLLSEFYSDPELASVSIKDVDVDSLITAIRECNTITGPYIRESQPEKNFAQVHNLDLTPSDYLNIIHQVTKDELKGAMKSHRLERLGIVMYEFIHDPKGYRLKYSRQIIEGNIKIYIKLIPHYANTCNVLVVSFHDPLD